MSIKPIFKKITFKCDVLCGVLLFTSCQRKVTKKIQNPAFFMFATVPFCTAGHYTTPTLLNTEIVQMLVYLFFFFFLAFQFLMEIIYYDILKQTIGIRQKNLYRTMLSYIPMSKIRGEYTLKSLIAKPILNLLSKYYAVAYIIITT